MDCALPDPACVAFHCFDGSLADPCASDAVCAAEAPYCGLAGCQTRREGSACERAAVATTMPFCAPDGLCRDGSWGDACAGDDQCLGGLVCGPSACQAGHEGEECNDASDCAGGSPFCTPEGICRDGNPGDPCVSAETCQDHILWGAGLCVQAQCREPDFVTIGPGTFTMGCPVDGGCEPATPYPDAHDVTLSHAVAMQAHEVTQADWSLLFGTSPASHPGCPQCPVEQVSLWDALAYANARSRGAGLEECYDLSSCHGTPGLDNYGCDQAIGWLGADCLGYRLPTEAEWEYAARAGTTTAFYFGALPVQPEECEHPGNRPLNEAAWYCGNSAGHPHPAAQLTENPWGLHETAGNVAEWVWDGAAAYPSDAGIDPVGPAPEPGQPGVQRGGGFADAPLFQQHGTRRFAAPETRSPQVGFRLVRTLSGEL
jgi:formylglycine-generating enzyme required for sulfatase activity